MICRNVLLDFKLPNDPNPKDNFAGPSVCVYIHIYIYIYVFLLYFHITITEKTTGVLLSTKLLSDI